MADCHVLQLGKVLYVGRNRGTGHLVPNPIKAITLFSVPNMDIRCSDATSHNGMQSTAPDSLAGGAEVLTGAAI
jgi:hypothetical protein